LSVEFSKVCEPVGFTESLIEALKRENNMSQALSFMLSAFRLDDAPAPCPGRDSHLEQTIGGIQGAKKFIDMLMKE
jgi:hypothetical protein